MFKKIFIDLCNSKKESPTAVCMKLGLSNATFSSWTDTTIPRKATLQRIADYFSVSVDYLIGESNEKEPAVNQNNELGENMVVFHRDGKTKIRKFTKEQMDILMATADAMPEKDKDEI